MRIAELLSGFKLDPAIPSLNLGGNLVSPETPDTLSVCPASPNVLYGH